MLSPAASSSSPSASNVSEHAALVGPWTKQAQHKKLFIIIIGTTADCSSSLPIHSLFSQSTNFLFALNPPPIKDHFHFIFSVIFSASCYLFIVTSLCSTLHDKNKSRIKIPSHSHYSLLCDTKILKGDPSPSDAQISLLAVPPNPKAIILWATANSSLRLYFSRKQRIIPRLNLPSLQKAPPFSSEIKLSHTTKKFSKFP